MTSKLGHYMPLISMFTCMMSSRGGSVLSEHCLTRGCNQGRILLACPRDTHALLPTGVTPASVCRNRGLLRRRGCILFASRLISAPYLPMCTGGNSKSRSRPFVGLVDAFFEPAYVLRRGLRAVLTPSLPTGVNPASTCRHHGLVLNYRLLIHRDAFFLQARIMNLGGVFALSRRPSCSWGLARL